MSCHGRYFDRETPGGLVFGFHQCGELYADIAERPDIDAAAHVELERRARIDPTRTVSP